MALSDFSDFLHCCRGIPQPHPPIPSRPPPNSQPVPPVWRVQVPTCLALPSLAAAMSQHVPAWKRLGLKLKGPASGEAIPSSGGPNAGAKPSPPISNAHAPHARVNGSPASALKRKAPASGSTPNAVSAHTPNKKPRRDEQAAANHGTPSSAKKSVSFADGTKDNAKVKASEQTKKKPKKKKTTNKAVDAPKSDFSLEPSLQYLRQWHSAKESWKFNKNHQTLLIKYIFDGDKIPSSDIPVFYEYIRDLKGFVRTRLRDTAAEIRKKDMEDGAAAFPASIKDKEKKQLEYQETISRFLQDVRLHQKQHNGAITNGNGKRPFDEVEYVIRVATPELKQRLLKRIRAEVVLDELSDSEGSSTSTATEATTTTTSSSTSSGQGATATAAADRNRPSDGSQQPAKRRRLRNVRTDIGDDDSSSSESDSSDSESESSSEEESEDEEMDLAPGDDPAESSSSSSSSSSEAEDDSEGSSEDESESGGSSSDEE